jgi:formate-dependent nitrite reductase membrane component NrfD
MEPDIAYVVQAGPYWDWRVALDLFFGGAGVGALLFGVAFDTALPGRQRRLCQTAAWLAPLLILLGLGFLLLEMGRPHRLFLTFVQFVPTSPLWWGGIFQLLLVIGSLWYAWQWRGVLANERARRRLGWALAPIAIIVGAYHGLLLAVVTARPLWNTGPTVVAALLCFAATGIATVVLVHLVRAKIVGRLADPELLAAFLKDMVPARNLLAAVLVAQLGTFYLWWLSLGFGTLQDQQALAAANASHGPMFWWLGIAGGLVLPLVIASYVVWRGEANPQRLQVALLGACCALIVIGGLFFRLALVLGGQSALPIPSLS